MGIKIEVKPETAKKLQSLAAGKGVSVDELLRGYIPGISQNGKDQANVGQTEKLSEFTTWLDQYSTEGGAISEEALSRDSIYPDR